MMKTARLWAFVLSVQAISARVPGAEEELAFFFLDGRYIEPPYEVRRKGAKVFVNDLLAIDMWDEAIREVEGRFVIPPPDEISLDDGDVERIAVCLYAHVLRENPGAEARAVKAVKKFLNSQVKTGKIRSFEIEDDVFVLATPDDDEYDIECKGTEPAVPSRADIMAAAERDRARLRDELRRPGVVFLWRGGKERRRFEAKEGTFRRLLASAKVLEEARQGDEEKKARLVALGWDHYMAEVIAGSFRPTQSLVSRLQSALAERGIARSKKGQARERIEEAAAGPWDVEFPEVNDGYVVVRGKYLPPPYKVTILDRILYVNGIEVQRFGADAGVPRDEAARRAQARLDRMARPRAEADIDTAEDWSDAIVRCVMWLWWEKARDEGREQAAREVRAFLRRRAEVRCFRFEGSTVWIQFWDDDECGATFSDPTYREPALEGLDIGARRYADGLANDLRQGRLIFLETGGPSRFGARPEKAWKVLTALVEALEDTRSSKEEDIRKLQRVLGHPPFILQKVLEQFKVDERLKERLRKRTPVLVRKLVERGPDREDEIIEMGYKAKPELLRLVSIGSEREKLWAAHLLTRLGDRSGMGAILAALASEDPELRKEAGERLSAVGTATEVPALIEAAKTSDCPRSVFSALRKIGDRRALPVLESALLRMHRRVSYEAAEALFEMTGKRYRFLDGCGRIQTWGSEDPLAPTGVEAGLVGGKPVMTFDFEDGTAMGWERGEPAEKPARGKFSLMAPPSEDRFRLFSPELSYTIQEDSWLSVRVCADKRILLHFDFRLERGRIFSHYACEGKGWESFACPLVGLYGLGNGRIRGEAGDRLTLIRVYCEAEETKTAFHIDDILIVGGEGGVAEPEEPQDEF